MVHDYSQDISNSILLILSSMAASRPDLIIKKWAAFENKEGWYTSTSRRPFHKSCMGAELLIRRDQNHHFNHWHLQIYSSMSELGNHRGAHGTFSSSAQSLWILYVHVLSVTCLSTAICLMLLGATRERLLYVEAAGVIAAGPRALTVLVVAGLPRETVVFLVHWRLESLHTPHIHR